MPHATSGGDNDFKHIQVKELHPTFGAEVYGVDFSKPVPEDVFSELYKAITKVSMHNPRVSIHSMLSHVFTGRTVCP
jgi:hypothetical protein